jgi:hypothetical protein
LLYQGLLIPNLSSDVDTLYTNKLRNTLVTDPTTWDKEIDDWKFMRLKKDLVKDKDYVLVSNQVWKKLFLKFGGAPEIGFNIVDCRNVQVSDSTNTTEQPDLSPITVNVWYFGEDSNEPLAKGILTSQFIGPKVFLANTTSAFYNFAPTKVKVLLAWKGENNKLETEEICTKGASTKKLIDYGVVEGSHICIHPNEVESQNRDFKKKIAKALGAEHVANLNDNFYEAPE